MNNSEIKLKTMERTDRIRNCRRNFINYTFIAVTDVDENSLSLSHKYFSLQIISK